MKIGIITYHDTLNYGAALQAYATQAALRALGVDAEIIDYTNEIRSAFYSVRHRFQGQLRRGQFGLALKTLLGAPLIQRRQRHFSLFYREHLRLGPRRYVRREDLKNAPPAYDAYVAGSDQIWSERNNGGDLNYLLDFVRDSGKTLSYASSFGAVRISDRLCADYARLLGRIRSLSVRERSGADLVFKLTGRRPPVVVDPVFLLDDSEWSRLAATQIPVAPPYVLVYVSQPRFLDDFLRTTGYGLQPRRVVHIASTLHPSDLVRKGTTLCLTASPETFLGLIRGADLILTSSFHGTAFSVLMNRPFVSFLANDAGRDARIVDLLANLGLSDRIHGPAMTAASVGRPIDFKAVNEKLARLRQQSIDFLREALKRVSSEDILDPTVGGQQAISTSREGLG